MNQRTDLHRKAGAPQILALYIGAATIILTGIALAAVSFLSGMFFGFGKSRTRSSLRNGRRFSRYAVLAFCQKTCRTSRVGRKLLFPEESFRPKTISMTEKITQFESAESESGGLI